MILAGTGHRPQDLECGFIRKHPWKLKKLALLKAYLQGSLHEIEYVISGAALGWDTYLMFTSLKLNIPTHAYVPFQGQECRWSAQQQKQYHEMLEKCDKVVEVCPPGYSGWKMMRRNEAMVDKADLILSLWNPQKKYGGTFNCLAYAHSKQKPVVNFWGDKPEPLEFY